MKQINTEKKNFNCYTNILFEIVAKSIQNKDPTTHIFASSRYSRIHLDCRLSQYLYDKTITKENTNDTKST